MNSIKKQIVIGFLILLVCVFISSFLINLKEPIEKVIPPVPKPFVEILEVFPETIELSVTGYGTVQPKREVSIVPEVSGRIVDIREDLKLGSQIKKGETFAKIDSTNYESFLAEASLVVARAKRQLEEIKSQKNLALHDWREARQRNSDLPELSPLALFQPQLEEAEAELQSAHSKFKKAKRDLKQTSLIAPFDCFLTQESLEIGQVLTAGQNYGMLIDSHSIEVHTTFPYKELSWLRDSKDATITSEFSDRTTSWKGTVSRTLPTVDPQSRLTTFVIDVENPFQKSQKLRFNDYVKVQVKIPPIPDVYRLPRHVVSSDLVWIIDDKSTLQYKKISVIRYENETVIISGLKPADKVVISPLLSPEKGSTVSLGENQ